MYIISTWFSYRTYKFISVFVSNAIISLRRQWQVSIVVKSNENEIQYTYIVDAHCYEKSAYAQIQLYILN